MAQGTRTVTHIIEKGAGMQLALILEDTEHGVGFRVVRNIPHITGSFTPAEALLSAVLGYLNGLSYGDDDIIKNPEKPTTFSDNLVPFSRKPKGNKNNAT